MKKVYHLRLTIKQFKKEVIIATRVFDSIYRATEAIKDLNDIFHNTILKVEMDFMEEDRRE